MSRTWKDRPDRVKLKENMAKGLIDHEHLLLGREARVYITPWANRGLALAFPKGDLAAIKAHRALLDGLKAEGTLESYAEVELPGERQASIVDDRIVFTHVPKRISFEVPTRRVATPQEYCTDAEHYDSLTGTDTRNGLRAVCTPEWTREIGAKYRGRIHNRNSRAAVKSSLRYALRNVAMDDLDNDGYSDPTYEVDYGKKIWMD